MPTAADTVSLLIDGQMHDDWSSYDLDSDLLIPADAWRVTLVRRYGSLPEAVRDGARVEVRVGSDPVLVGRIDEVGEDVGKGGVRIDIGGRDGAAILVDCSSPIFTAQMIGLDDVIAKIVRPLGIEQVRVDAENARLREKINVEPGDTAWETLRNAAEANGLWPWFEPDGTLVVGGPNYEQPPVATLVMNEDGIGNNVLRLARRRSIQGRFSEVTVLGQKRGTSVEAGRHALKGKVKDDGVSWYRPLVTVDYEAESQAVCESRARKLIADSRLKGMTLTAEVTGHRIVAPGQAADGKLWKPGQRVHVTSDTLRIDATYFLMARKFTGGRNEGPRTQLTLKEDRAWVLDAHPHKKNHRLGKNAAPLEIIDASKGAAQ